MDVFVFQMGKVGSSAMTVALRERGLNAVQTHWLGKETLYESLEHSLLNVELEDEIAFRGEQEWLQNLRNTRTLLWYQKHRQRHGQRLKIITLGRDPLSWYWGHLAENFDLYGPCIQQWYQQTFQQAPQDMGGANQAFHQAMFECFGRIDVDVIDPAFPDGAVQQRVNGVSVRFLAEQMMKVRLPTVWFDLFFKPVLGIDIFQRPIRDGVARYKNDYAEVLLIRYEDLENALGTVREFLQLDELTLPVTNQTAAKELPFDLTGFAQEFEPDEKGRAALYRTPYCRHFGYRTR
ncbi:MAG: putative capsular polysaccharide synthesis family protein [Pseudomonadota bacterium]